MPEYRRSFAYINYTLPLDHIMESLPLITVIIPVYNTGTYLHQCLQSACGQTHKNLEIICVDDGSTDDSLAILREYEARDKRIRVLTANHGGAAAARNLALDIARGEWVIGLDSDDWLAPEAYERVLAHAKDGVDIVFFSAEPVCNEGDDFPEREKTLKRYKNYYQLKPQARVPADASLAIQTPVSPCLALRRRSIIERYHLRFMEGHIHEDEDFHFHFMSHVSYATFCADVLYYRRLRAGSVMLDPHKERLEDLVPLFAERLFLHYKETGVLDAYWPAVVNMLTNRGYTQKSRSSDEELNDWRRTIRHMAVRCGMAADRRFLPALAEIEGKQADPIFRFRLLGALPLLKIVDKPSRYSVLLFDFLPLWTVRRKPTQTTWCLLGIPLLKSSQSWDYRRFLHDYNAEAHE